jgi:hypothetical protein
VNSSTQIELPQLWCDAVIDPKSWIIVDSEVEFIVTCQQIKQEQFEIFMNTICLKVFVTKQEVMSKQKRMCIKTRE